MIVYYYNGMNVSMIKLHVSSLTQHFVGQCTKQLLSFIRSCYGTPVWWPKNPDTRTRWSW